MDLQEIVDEAFRDAETYRGHGAVSSYAPPFAAIDSRRLGIAVMLGDGTSYVAGDADVAFSLQSISYVFSLSLALQLYGPALWNHVGREPSGPPAHLLLQLQSDRGKPRNPLINAGAIAVCDTLLRGQTPEGAREDIVAFLRDRSDDDGISIDERVVLSESQYGHFNRGLAHFMAAHGALEAPVEDLLSVYFGQCAIGMSCRQMARAALYLAFDGNCPITGDSVILSNRARRINALMLTCGHYDNSGEFAFRIGLPGKSSISGGILTIVPGVGTVAVWSPGLNSAGSSLAGAVLLEKLVEKTEWSVFV